jgi:hypothetical protein
MAKKIRGILKAGLVNSGGSVTVEAAIVLPVILLMLFGMVFFSMYVYHKLILLDTAVYTAAQRAETWDHSNKNLDDGLYWRLFSDLSGFVNQEGAQISTGGPELVRKKSTTAVNLVKNMLQYEIFKSSRTKITVQYRNLVTRRIVSVGIYEHIINPVNWLSKFFNPNLAYRVEADVVEPAEFIRMMGLAGKYSSEILSSFDNIPNPFIKDETDLSQPRQLFASKGVQYGQRVRVFHYHGCRYISRIKPENLIEFNSLEQANNAGYYLCMECAKRMTSDD